MTLQWCCIRWWRFSSILHGLMCDTRPDKEQLPQAGWKNCYRNSQTGSTHLICRKPITDIKVKEQRSSLQCAEQLLLNAGAAWEGKSQSSYSAGRRDVPVQHRFGFWWVSGSCGLPFTHQWYHTLQEKWACISLGDKWRWFPGTDLEFPAKKPPQTTLSNNVLLTREANGLVSPMITLCRAGCPSASVQRVNVRIDWLAIVEAEWGQFRLRSGAWTEGPAVV